MARRNPLVRDVARALLPLRRLAGRFALVDLERLNREIDVAAARRDIVERVDLVLQEYWRRSEGFDARMATVVQQLEQHVTKVTADVHEYGLDIAGVYAVAVERGSAPSDADQAGESNGNRATTDHPRSAEATRGSVLTLSRQRLFDWRERGSYEHVLDKLSMYRPYIEGHAPLLDLGCGRGEFLDLARQAGISAYGVDLSDESIADAHARGFDVRHEDLFEHLRTVAAESLGAVVSSQVVEHLPAERLSELFDLISRVLRSGGICIIETPNPATFATHVQSFWRDPTHIRPVPAEALKFWAKTSGLAVDRILYSAQVPAADRLQKVPDPEGESAVVLAFNRLVEQLNELLYGYQDYALIATKP